MGFSVQVRVYADSGPAATVEFTSPPDQPVGMRELGRRIGDVVRALKHYVGDDTDELYYGIRDTFRGSIPPAVLTSGSLSDAEFAAASGGEAPPDWFWRQQYADGAITTVFPKTPVFPQIPDGGDTQSVMAGNDSAAPGWHVERSGTEEVVSLTLPLDSPQTVVTAAIQQVPDEYRHTAQLLFNQEMLHQRVQYRRPFVAVPQAAPANGTVSMAAIWAAARELLCEPPVDEQGILYTWLTAAELERAKASFAAEHPVRAVLDTLVPRPDKGQLTGNSSQWIVPTPTGRSSSEPEDKY